MVGSGGMVAVVEGLQDAGLAVTLLSHRDQPSGRSVLAGLLGIAAPTQACQTVAVSATETAIKDASKSSPYKSNYQMDHCQSPAFSSVHLAQYAFTGVHQYRSSSTRSRDEEAFVESLRKYPISPVRSRSADLIERMLSYTQCKNGARHSKIRSAKSLPPKETSKYLHSDEIPTRDTGITTNDLKPNFGYKRDVELIPAPMSNKKSRNDSQIGMYDYLKSNYKDKKLKGSEVRYLTNVKQCLRERLRQICDEEPAAICPKIQKRYSLHKRQYHKAEASQKSQKGTDCKESITQVYSQNETQNSPSTSRERKGLRAHKPLSSFKHSKACFCNRPSRCDCGTQLSRFILKPKTRPEYLESDFTKKMQCLSICEYDCNEAIDIYSKQLREAVSNWSKDLPVYANFSTCDAMRREKIINKLIDTLGKLQKDNTFFGKVEDEIKKCLKILPMWRPENKVNQESFESQLSMSLLQKIKYINEKFVISDKNEFKDEISKWFNSIPLISNRIDKEKNIKELFERLKPIALNQTIRDKNYKENLKSEIMNVLIDLPIECTGSRTTTINNIADNLVERLHTIPSEQSPSVKQIDIKNIVLDWVKHISQILEDINLNNDDNVLVNDLIKRLNNLQNNYSDGKQKQLNDEIINWLNFLEEKKKYRIDDNTKNRLTAQLIDKLVYSYQENKPKQNLNDVIQKWLDDIPDILGITFVDDQRYVQLLTTKLQDLQNIEDNENQLNSMRQEILKWLQNLHRNQDRHVDSGLQENLVNKLLSMIKNKSNQENSVVESDLITQNIWKWLKSQPEFNQDRSLQYKDMVIELSKKLQDIKDKKREHTEYNIKKEIENWLKKLSQKHGIKIKLENQKKLQDKILSTISPIKRRKNWEKPNNIQELISKELSQLFNDLVIPLEEKDKKLLQNQITEAITQDWNAIHSKETNESFSKITSIWKQATKQPETEIISLIQTLIEKVKETLSNSNDITQEEPLALDNKYIYNTSKVKLRSKIEENLKTLSLKNNQQLVETITDTLIKTYEDNTGKAFEAICEILKNADMSESEAKEMTNKILNISNQLRNEDSDATYKTLNFGSTESLRMHKQTFMQRLEQELTDFMERVLNESSSFCKNSLEDSIKHYNHFKNPVKKTSTPTKSDSEEDINVETQYKNQIKEIIRKWICSLEIDDIIDDSFKDTMVNDIATDIIDRQRYAQHSKTKRSSQDEMEHLKYQIFKWTSKLPKLIDLSTKADEIKTLINSLEVLEKPDLIRNANKPANRNVDGAEYKGNYSIIRNTSEFLEENIYSAIWNWLNRIPNLKPKSSDDRRIIDNLIVELSRKLTNLINSEPKTQAPNVEYLYNDEIVNCLRKFNRHLENNEEQLEHRASDLINYLKDLKFFADISKQNHEILPEAANRLQKKEIIKRAVQGWCQKLPLKRGKTRDDMTDIIESLAESVSQYLLIKDTDNINRFMEDILNNLKKLPLQFDKEDSKDLPVLTERLIETLKGVFNDSEKYHSLARKPPLKKPVDRMHDYINNWCENLPLDLDITNEDIEQVNMIKQNLAGELQKKVATLNVDPEIFQDNYLYEDILKDEIEKVLNIVPKTPQFKEMLPKLKENLMKDIIQAKEEMKNEIEGFAYKQQLRDIICKTLSSIGFPIMEETSFDVLKDKLADAFISLHYIADHDELKRKFKEKIFNEVNKFCNDYLKRNPSKRLNAHYLNQELYKALKKVPVPKDESMRREVEQIRLKDIINDWFKDFPLEESPSHLQENKIISILAKRLHEIENEAELNLAMDVDEIMNDEITKWLKKFKLKPENESSIEPVKKQLINKLKDTKYSRKFDDSTTRKSINYADLTSGLVDYQYYPPSNLSPEDQAYLQRIRDRTSTERTILKPDDTKNASLSPVPIATGMQTEEKLVIDYIFQKNSQNASMQTIIQDPEPPTSITPQVIVKEYYWNSNGSPTVQCSRSILSCMQPPTTQLAGSVQRKTKTTPQETLHSACQTIPLPACKATVTQDMPIDQAIETLLQNDNIGASTKNCCLSRVKTTAQQQLSNETNKESQTGHCSPGDCLQLNIKKRAEIKFCKPCQGRAVLSGEFNSSLEAGTSKAIQQIHSARQRMSQDTNERLDFHRPDCWSAGRTNEHKKCLYDQEHLNQPYFRRPTCQIPTRDMECRPKLKRRYTCRNPTLTKCTIRPQSPCQHYSQSNKSCSVSKKLCPKCWDGFCPYPSYLYFTQD